MTSPLRWLALATVTLAGLLGCGVENPSHANLAYPAGPQTHARVARGAAALGCSASSGLDGRVTTVQCGDAAVVIYDELRNDGRWYVAAHCEGSERECRDFAQRILDAGSSSTPGVGGGPR